MKTIFCIASTEFQAESILNELRVGGLKDDALAVLVADKTRAIVRGVTGSVPTDSAIGWLPEVESLVISGAGAFIGSGLLARALKESAAGSHKGAIARAFTGLGISSEQADVYDEKLRAGKVVVCALTESDEQTQVVKSVFERAQAEEILVASEARPLEHAPRVRQEKWEKW